MNSKAYSKTEMYNFNLEISINPIRSVFWLLNINGWTDFQSVNTSELVFLEVSLPVSGIEFDKLAEACLEPVLVLQLQGRRHTPQDWPYSRLNSQ